MAHAAAHAPSRRASFDELLPRVPFSVWSVLCLAGLVAVTVWNALYPALVLPPNAWMPPPELPVRYALSMVDMLGAGAALMGACTASTMR